MFILFQSHNHAYQAYANPKLTIAVVTVVVFCCAERMRAASLWNNLIYFTTIPIFSFIFGNVQELMKTTRSGEEAFAQPKIRLDSDNNPIVEKLKLLNFEKFMEW